MHLSVLTLLKVVTGPLASGAPCLQSPTTANTHTKEQEGDLSKLSKDGDHGKPRASSEAQSNIFVLRKMVEEVFTVLYSKKQEKKKESHPRDLFNCISFFNASF